MVTIAKALPSTRAISIAGLALASFIVALAFFRRNLLTQWQIPIAIDKERARSQFRPSSADRIAIVHISAPPRPRGNDSSISPIPRNLILTATRPGRTPHEGFADLGTDAGSPQTYRVNAILANGAQLAAIYADYVLLTKGQQSARLYVNQSLSQAVRDLTTVGGDRPEIATGGTSWDGLTDVIRPTPVYDGDTLRGYQVYAGSKSWVFGKLGLLPGDVIVGINGGGLSTPQSDIDRLESLADGASVSVTLARSDGPVTITINGSVVQSALAGQNMPNSNGGPLGP
jgi:hypothetical protein